MKLVLLYKATVTYLSNPTKLSGETRQSLFINDKKYVSPLFQNNQYWMIFLKGARMEGCQFGEIDSVSRKFWRTIIILSSLTRRKVSAVVLYADGREWNCHLGDLWGVHHINFGKTITALSFDAKQNVLPLINYADENESAEKRRVDCPQKIGLNERRVVNFTTMTWLFNPTTFGRDEMVVVKNDFWHVSPLFQNN